jgi:hypothetical protein
VQYHRSSICLPARTEGTSSHQPGRHHVFLRHHFVNHGVTGNALHSLCFACPSRFLRMWYACGVEVSFSLSGVRFLREDCSSVLSTRRRSRFVPSVESCVRRRGYGIEEEKALRTCEELLAVKSYVSIHASSESSLHFAGKTYKLKVIYPSRSSS